MRWYRNLNFLYNMKKVTIVFDFESQSMDVSVNDARECVTPATTVEEMLANEVFAFACGDQKGNRTFAKRRKNMDFNKTIATNFSQVVDDIKRIIDTGRSVPNTARN